MGGALSPHFHKLCAHRLHAVFFISVTFNKIMAMEEIKLTQNVHNEALSADISGMVQTLSWTLKRQKPSFFPVIFNIQKYLNLTINNSYSNLHCLGHSKTPQK